MSGPPPGRATDYPQRSRPLRRFGPCALVLVLAAAAVVLWLRGGGMLSRDDPAATAEATIATSGDGACCNVYMGPHALSDIPPPEIPTGSGLPCVVVLGSGGCCDDCLKMRTMLEEMRPRLEGLADVVVVDTDLYPQEAQRWRLRLTPTEIVVDAEGAEVVRLEGAMPQEQVIGALRDAGIAVE